MEHELRLATHQQRAGGQDDGSLNKLPQMSHINTGKSYMAQDHFKTLPYPPKGYDRFNKSKRIQTLQFDCLSS